MQRELPVSPDRMNDNMLKIASDRRNEGELQEMKSRVMDK